MKAGQANAKDHAYTEDRGSFSTSPGQQQQADSADILSIETRSYRMMLDHLLSGQSPPS